MLDAHHHFRRYTPEEYDWIGDDIAAWRRTYLLEEERRIAGVDGLISVQACHLREFAKREHVY